MGFVSKTEGEEKKKDLLAQVDPDPIHVRIKFIEAMDGCP